MCDTLRNERNSLFRRHRNKAGLSELAVSQDVGKTKTLLNMGTTKTQSFDSVANLSHEKHALYHCQVRQHWLKDHADW